MFRKMVRDRQQLSKEECEQLLQQEKRGVLSVLGDDGYPYGVPMDFVYLPERGTICFHGSRKGHKQDALAACDKASFCVYDAGTPIEGDWALRVRSVIVFGRVRRIEDPALKEDVCRRLCRKFTDDEAYAEKELRSFSAAVRCLELVPEHISGKLVTES